MCNTAVKKLEWSVEHILCCYKDIEMFEHDYGYRLTDQQFKKLSSAITHARNTIHGVMMEGCKQIVVERLEKVN
jgi:hypothetical protein